MTGCWKSKVRDISEKSSNQNVLYALSIHVFDRDITHLLTGYTINSREAFSADVLSPKTIIQIILSECLTVAFRFVGKRDYMGDDIFRGARPPPLEQCHGLESHKRSRIPSCIGVVLCSS